MPSHACFGSLWGGGHLVLHTPSLERRAGEPALLLPLETFGQSSGTAQLSQFTPLTAVHLTASTSAELTCTFCGLLTPLCRPLSGWAGSWLQKACHQLHLRAEAPTGGKRDMPVAHYPHAMGAEALARSRPPEASQGTSQLQQRERAAQLGCFQRFPLSFPHPLLYRPTVAEEEASWQQQSPATGSPPGSAARFIPRPSLLPGPWHLFGPWQAPLSDHSRRGHRLLSPTAAPHLFPGRWRSPNPSPPHTAAPLSQAGPCLDVPRRPVSGPRALASPCTKTSPCSRAGLQPLLHEATASPKARAAHWLLAGRASQAFT